MGWTAYRGGEGYLWLGKWLRRSLASRTSFAVLGGRHCDRGGWGGNRFGGLSR